MIRTQLYLPDEQHQTLLKIAEHSGVSMAELVRNYIRSGLQHAQVGNDGSKKTMQSLAHMNLTSGPADLSSKLDHYLYTKDV